MLKQWLTTAKLLIFVILRCQTKVHPALPLRIKKNNIRLLDFAYSGALERKRKCNAGSGNQENGVKFLNQKVFFNGSDLNFSFLKHFLIFSLARCFEFMKDGIYDFNKTALAYETTSFHR